MNVNSGVLNTLEDCVAVLGGIDPKRIRLTPPPGQATVADLVRINESDSDRLYELVEGTLVEKAMSYEASVVAMAIVTILREFVSRHRLGLVSGPDGFFRLPMATRGPDVAYLSRQRLPGGKFPRQPYPELAPNLVVEVLSPGNTVGEMARKRLEYFNSSVELVWIVDCANRSVAVYTPNDSQPTILAASDEIEGGKVLPGFRSPVADFFADLDIGWDIA